MQSASPSLFLIQITGIPAQALLINSVCVMPVFFVTASIFSTFVLSIRNEIFFSIFIPPVPLFQCSSVLLHSFQSL